LRIVSKGRVRLRSIFDVCLLMSMDIGPLDSWNQDEVLELVFRQIIVADFSSSEFENVRDVLDAECVDRE
jgi:hypothetical protein